jgi:hypothetical protein
LNRSEGLIALVDERSIAPEAFATNHEICRQYRADLRAPPAFRLWVDGQVRRASPSQSSTSAATLQPSFPNLTTAPAHLQGFQSG